MHMTHRLRRLAARFLTISLLAATLLAVDSLTSSNPAEARCAGVNNPIKSTFSYNGTVRVSEKPVSGTCNGNGTYQGILEDLRGDGYCVSVWFTDGGSGWTRPPGGKTCGGHSEFHWTDRNGNTQAYEELCMEHASDPSAPLICGWGTAVGGVGNNSGY
jgi:hypothetical protein